MWYSDKTIDYLSGYHWVSYMSMDSLALIYQGGFDEFVQNWN